MKYKLYNEESNDYNLNAILKNRGIEDVDKWLNANKDDIYSPFLFPREKVNKAIKFLKDAIDDNWHLAVLIDSDVDGFTSAAIAINFLTEIKPDLKIDYIFHKNKGHGINDCFNDIPRDVDLLLTPDSSTNDIKELKELSKEGIKVLVADHHESLETYEDENVVVINNQICDYPNKDFSGAGVMWDICRAFEETYHIGNAWRLIDLAALGILSDMMDFRSLETRAVIQEGLKNITNEFFKLICKKHEFTMSKRNDGNIPTYMSVAFGVTPYFNAINRSGTMEEKQLVFDALLDKNNSVLVSSTKRGSKGVQVPLIEEAMLILERVKRRQTKLETESLALIEQKIKEQDLLKHGIIIVLCEPGEVERNLAGLISNKIQAKYQRPCYILTRSKTKEDEEYFFRGSGRNYSMSEIDNLQNLVLETGLPEYVSGHANAHGFSIAESKLQDFINITDEKYKNIPQEASYYVDAILRPSEVSAQDILSVANASNCWGQGVPQSQICIKDISINESNVQLLSEFKNPTLKITVGDITIMKFKSSRQEYEYFIEPNNLLTIIGVANANTWNGRTSVQILIDEFEIRKEWVF